MINSKIILNGLKKDLPTVKIIEPFQPSVIKCENKEDFSAIINSEPEKYSEMTTQKEWIFSCWTDVGLT